MSETKRFVILLPSTILSVILLGIVLYFYQRLEFLGLFRILFLALPVFILLPALLYPKMIEVRAKNEIENNIHLYITHMGVLSTSEVDRKELMKMLSERKEYKALAKETYKIYVLMDKWKRSLAQACKFVAKRTPSKIFSDFLDRMAHELDSGEDFRDFIKREQKVVMDTYATLYNGKLYSIDIFKEIYVSIIISLSFFAAFAIIVPFLTGISVMLTMGLIFIFFIIIEIGIFVYVKAVAPEDKIWQTSGERTVVDKKLYRLVALSILMILIIFSALLFADYIYRIIDIPFSFIIALSITPLLIPGILSRKEERHIIEKDTNAPSFLMSLGASASARGGDILESLKYLTAHDFGILTEDIKALYHKLKSRINKKRAWMRFAISTNSNLIYRFTDMFVEAINLGAEPVKVAQTISDNFITINNLRKRRFQSTSSFIGIAYGVVIGISFAIYVSYGVVEAMNALYSHLNIQSQMIGSLLHTVSEENLNIIPKVITLLLLFHSVISTFAIKTMDGGRVISGLIHTVGMMWVAAFSGHISQLAIKHFLGLGTFS